MSTLTLKDPYDVLPIAKPLSGTVTLPGSKSITNRALILAALTHQRITLDGALFSRDTRIMVAALQTLGFDVSTDPDQQQITIQGQGGHIPNNSASLHVGNAGTAARFLTAFLALSPQGQFTLDGDEAMRLRPMAGLTDCLTQLGIGVHYQDQLGHFPFTISGKKVLPCTLDVDASASSQILSALLMILPQLPLGTTLQLADNSLRQPFIRMTLAMMKDFGVHVQEEQGRFFLDQEQSYQLPSTRYLIEPDISAASYFFCLPLACGGKLRIKNVANIQLQGDKEFLPVMQSFGLQVQADGDDLQVQAEQQTYHPAQQTRSINFNTFSDTFLGLAALSPLLRTDLTITGIAHTRHQETDRVAAMATELEKLGQQVWQTEDSLRILPQPLQAATIHTYEDHRVAMSFGVLGSHNWQAEPWISIEDPDCCGKTFPQFFSVLASLHPHE